MKSVTVIMRTFNCDWVVDQALASVMQQKDIDIKLMIVDSGSTDRTLEMVSHYKHEFIAIEPGTYFPGKVLNQAVEAADTEYIVFINSDVVLLDEHALRNLIIPLEQENTVATFGRQVIRPEADLWVRHDYERAFPASGEHPVWMHYSLPIASMKKSIWKEEHFYTDAWGSEDTHWAVQIKNKGYDIAYVNNALAMHSHNYTFKQLASRRRIEGEADVYIYPDKKVTLGNTFLSFVASSVRESWYYLKNKALFKVPDLVMNRMVYSWHYYQGFKHASKHKESITFGNYQ